MYTGADRLLEATRSFPSPNAVLSAAVGGAIIVSSLLKSSIETIGFDVLPGHVPNIDVSLGIPVGVTVGIFVKASIRCTSAILRIGTISTEVHSPVFLYISLYRHTIYSGPTTLVCTQWLHTSRMVAPSCDGPPYGATCRQSSCGRLAIHGKTKPRFRENLMVRNSIRVREARIRGLFIRFRFGRKDPENIEQIQT